MRVTWNAQAAWKTIGWSLWDEKYIGIYEQINIPDELNLRRDLKHDKIFMYFYALYEFAK